MSWIPEITNERLTELVERIKPVVRMAHVITKCSTDNDGNVTAVTPRLDPSGDLRRWDHDGSEPYYIEPVDPKKIAYMWDPKPTEKAEGLIKICDITTFHTFGYHGLFKPSIAEVLAMIPEGMTEVVVAFEIVKSPETADDLNEYHVATNAGYHVARTRLYTKG